MDNNKGFTLIEILIAVSIVATLAAIAISSYISYRKNSIRATVLSDIRNCLMYVVSEQHNGSTEPVSSIVSRCPASHQLDVRLELVSESPLIITGMAINENISCTYSENNGSVNCDPVF